MPSRPRLDQLAAALAATEALAYLGNDDRLGQGVNVHVRLVPALTGRDYHADAVLAHVRQRHGRAGLFTRCHFHHLPLIFSRMVA
jgi:hypothetical protein